jgi:polysaccharide deacetylase family protein (PEP-CTERM system associated)
VPHVLTVDVEDWFHVCGTGTRLGPATWESLPTRVVDNTQALLDLLDRCDVRATFFVLGYIAHRYPRLVESIMQRGHEIGSHGYMHQRVYDLGPQAFEEDVSRSINALRACGVRTVHGFRAPEWSINTRSLWALDVLARQGFRFDSSMAPLRLVGDPSFPKGLHRRSTSAGDIIECPPAVERRFGQQVPLGGWGLRMSRPGRILRLLAARDRAGATSVLWVHPWEIDDDPPHVRLPWAQNFAHYFRLQGFRGRLQTILKGAAFGPLGPLVGTVRGVR